MSSIGVRFDIDFEPDAPAIQAGFENWAKLIKDWRPVFQDVVKLFLRHEERHFDTEGRSTGKQFHQLSEDYEAWKDWHYPGRPILTARGLLRNALTNTGTPEGAVRKVTSHSLTVGLDSKSDSDVAKYGVAHARAQGPAYKYQRKPRPPVRYDPTIHTKKVTDLVVGGGAVPLGTAIAQLAQINIVRARKQAFGMDDPFAEGGNPSLLTRGVLNLKTR